MRINSSSMNLDRASWSLTMNIDFSIDFQSILLHTPFAGFVEFRRGHHSAPGFLPVPSVPFYLQRNVFIQSVSTESDRTTIVNTYSSTQESRQTPILQDFHICRIHHKEENHILSGKSYTLADLSRHICLKLLSEKELRSWHVQRKAPSTALSKLMS